jgi:hypothetical protein
MVINSSLFPFSFFLSSRVKVNSLQAGAKKYGGATQFKNAIYSNVAGDNNIKINKTNNIISIFIPSTININQKIDNSEFVQYSENYLMRFFGNTYTYNSKGSWYSDELKKVIIENIAIIQVTLNKVTEQDINIFINLAKHIKQEMRQEGVSITINNSLAIV